MSTYAQYQGYLAFATLNLVQGLKDIRRFKSGESITEGPLWELSRMIRNDNPQICQTYFTFGTHIIPIFQDAATNYLLEHFDSQVLDKVT